MIPNFEIENEYYRKALYDHKTGKVAREYLKKRCINEETIEKWKLGWSPYECVPSIYNDWVGDYKPWSKLWGRITIPIYDQNGKVVSISGRLVLKIDKPKYDHYSFPSRKVLFGLFQNKEEIQKNDRAIITEGQMDVISSWQKGLRIVTSSFGAHCSLDHLAILSRYATRIDVLYDNDFAGNKGLNDIKKFTTHGDLIINLKQGIFPYGDDLDSWINKNSIDRLFNLLDSSKTDNLKNKLKKIKMKL